MKRILVIDDELVMAGNAEEFIRHYAIPDFEFDFCASFEEAVRLQYWDYSLILLDIRFEGQGDDYGITILGEIRKRSSHVPVVMLSSRTTPEILIRCWDAGAQAYVLKWTVNKRFHRDLSEKVLRYARYFSPQPIIGVSRVIQDLRSTIATLAGYDISVLITGETGVGKELVAKALHDQGKRSDKPFVALNAGAIPSTLIESELFGHVKGAFTGATDRRGKVEAANGGTLFLDEIGDLPLDMQVKLLRLLDSGEYVRVGENAPRKADLRVVAATNRDLAELVKAKTFREDLFFRLNGFKVHIPALRERLDDLPLLAEHFLELFKNTHPEKSMVTSFSAPCMKAMQAYRWPGNIRELRNAVERAVILTVGETIDLPALPPSISETNSPSISPTGGKSPATGSLPSESDQWSKERLMHELHLALEAKRRVQAYKGKNWKAEFMRLMYPECKAANAKGFDDLIRRLTKGPWGDPDWEKDNDIASSIRQLRD